MDISRNLKKRANDLNIKQVDLCKKMEIPKTTMNGYFSGTREPDISTLKRLAEALDTSVEYLIGESNSHISHQQPTTRKSVRVPVVGKIPAGIPLEAIEDLVDWEEIPEEWTRGNQEYFALKVQGDSMSPKYLDGDTVIFLKAQDCENGAECAVIVNGEDATFKKVIKHQAGIFLQPLNTAEYEPAFYSTEQIEEMPVRIVGIAKELRRKS